MEESRSTRREFLTGVTASTALGGCLGRSRGDTVTVGLVPDVDPDTAIQQNTELATYLETELGVAVELETTADYAGMVRAMVAEQVDIAYFGGVSYILARHRAGAEPLVVGSKAGETTWNSAFVVPADADIAGMDDVTGRASELELVFGDPISTSGTVMPTYYLEAEFDLEPKADFDQVTHTGAHDATARTISNATTAIGALNARVYDALVEAGSVDGVREIWRTPGFPDYPWTVAPTLEHASIETVRKAFTGLDERGRTDILHQQRVDRYVEVTHEAFTSLETAVEMAGIDPEKNA